MKLISWNCQGLGSALTIHALKALVAKEEPDLIFLMETKNRTDVLQRLQTRLNFQLSFVLDPLGLAGGTLMMYYTRGRKMEND